MTILPLQLIMNQIGLLTVQFDAVSLETWHVEGLWDFIEPLKTSTSLQEPKP